MGTANEEQAVAIAIVHDFTAQFPGTIVLDPYSSLDTTDLGGNALSLLPTSFSDLLATLLAVNATAARTPELSDLASVSVITARDDQREALSSAGYLGPNAFTEAFPGPHAVLRLSRPVFGRDGRTALVSAAFTCGCLCGEGSLYCLALTGSDWTIVYRQQLYVS